MRSVDKAFAFVFEGRDKQASRIKWIPDNLVEIVLAAWDAATVESFQDFLLGEASRGHLFKCQTNEGGLVVWGYCGLLFLSSLVFL